MVPHWSSYLKNVLQVLKFRVDQGDDRDPGAQCWNTKRILMKISHPKPGAVVCGGTSL
jgi:hypothetical protein